MSSSLLISPYNFKGKVKFKQSVMDLLRPHIESIVKNFGGEEEIKNVNQIILGTYTFPDWLENLHPDKIEFFDKYFDEPFNNVDEFSQFFDIRDEYLTHREKAFTFVSKMFHKDDETKL